MEWRRAELGDGRNGIGYDVPMQDDESLRISFENTNIPCRTRTSDALSVQKRERIINSAGRLMMDDSATPALLLPLHCTVGQVLLRPLLVGGLLHFLDSWSFMGPLKLPDRKVLWSRSILEECSLPTCRSSGELRPMGGRRVGACRTIGWEVAQSS